MVRDVLLSANTFNLDKAKILSRGKGLTPYRTTKFLELLKSIAFADDKSKVIQIVEIVFKWEENTVRKGENAGYKDFPPFCIMFPGVLFLKVVKIHNCMLTHVNPNIRLFQTERACRR